MTSVDRSYRQKMNKETSGLKDTLEQIDSIVIYRTFYPKVAEYAFFSGAHGAFSMIDHTSGHKINVNKLKKTEITSSIFSDHMTWSEKSIARRKLDKSQIHKYVQIKRHATEQSINE